MPEKKLNTIPWYQRRPLVALAPMEAITDQAYRSLCRSVAPDVVMYTEFVPANGLLRGGDKVRQMATFAEEERPLVVQIYDHDLDAIGEAAGVIAREMRPDGLDINMGCPVRKVALRGAGCGMMADPVIAGEAVKRVVDASGGIPVSAKMRLGIKQKDEVLEVVARCIEAGAKQVTIHARLKADRPRIPADWDALESAARQLDTTIIGNGDIWNIDDALRMSKLDGIDGVMIGRGAIGNPWLLQRAWQALAGVEIDSPPDRDERIRVALEHLQLNVRDKGERRGVLELRKVVRNYIKGFPDSRRTWMKIIEVETEKETAAILEEFVKIGQKYSFVDYHLLDNPEESESQKTKE